MCDDRERLLGYLYNEGDDAERRDVEQHLQSCETCREELGGLRATRQDLLAWDVPEHGSVWKPFVPAKVVPRWRDIPAWAMAAAAGLMFVVGAAGGVVTHALLEQNAAAEQVAAKTSTPPQAQPHVTQVALSATEQQMLRDMRAELASMQQRISARSATPANWTSFEQMADRINENDTRQYQNGLRLSNNLAALAKSTDARIEAITRNLQEINALLAQQAGK